MTLIQDQHDYYDSLYHLVQISVYKLNNPTEKDPSLKRQLLIRNLIILSSNLISTQPTTEELWFNACFDELDQEEDYDMEEKEKEENVVVMTFPFDYVTQDKPIRKTTLFLHVK